PARRPPDHYVTLVDGELAPKRLAMQRAETWGLLVARPLSFLSKVTRPLVWLLSKSADVIVRLGGGDPDRRSEEVTREEVRDLVAGIRSFDPQQREIIAGAFDISERSLRQVLRPRPQVVVLDEEMTFAEGREALIAAGYSRAPVAPGGRLDEVSGIVHIRDLISGSGRVMDRATPPLVFPDSAGALEALRVMRLERRRMPMVVSEHGSSEGIVTIEDLLEELVGEIYDEYDRDVLRARRHPQGVSDVPGSFPIHDLEDIGVDLPEGDYTTVAGMILDRLGRIPEEPGDEVEAGRWRATILEVEDRAITLVRLTPIAPG